MVSAAPHSAAWHWNARPVPHWSSRNGHFTSVHAASAERVADRPDGARPSGADVATLARAASPTASIGPFNAIVSSHDLDTIILDHGVCQKLLGRLLEQGLGAPAIGPVEFDVEHLALAHAGHSVDAKRLERALDRLALRVED